MNFDEAVGFYHSLTRFGVKPGLERIEALCAELGEPQKKFKCVHVAGTNGKGSTCTVIASVLRAAGYRVGLYTSPYVLEFRERIQLNGELIPKDVLCSVTRRVAEALETVNARGLFPTEFEAVTAAAFLFYAQSGCDIAVLETGLGGRFDATNIIDSPIASVITSVSLDHTAVLGETVGKIAWEKAGIIKPNRPVITSVRQPREASEVIEKCAKENGSELITVDDAKMFETVSETLFGSDVIYRGNKLHIPFGGEHQRENISLCIACFDVLRNSGFGIPDKAVQNGIANAFIPARTEIMCREPIIILDGSHNMSSTAALAALLKEYLPEQKAVAVMGMMADKDISSSLDNLLPCFSEVIATTPSNPRAMDSDSFACLVRKKGCASVAEKEPCKAVDTAFERAVKLHSAVVVCGSLYLAADVREHMRNEINRRFGAAADAVK